jgi:hypothetical protein
MNGSLPTGKEDRMRFCSICCCRTAKKDSLESGPHCAKKEPSGSQSRTTFFASPYEDY